MPGATSRRSRQWSVAFDYAGRRSRRVPLRAVLEGRLNPKVPGSIPGGGIGGSGRGASPPRRQGREAPDRRRRASLRRGGRRGGRRFSELIIGRSRVVQSPPWRRTSCARAGPPGRSWKSTKKSGSTSMPPSGEQLTRISHDLQPGVELVVPGRVERVGDVEPAPVERELDHLRSAAQLAIRRRSACRAGRRARAGRSAAGWRGRRCRTGAGRRAASSRSTGSGRPSRRPGR